MFSPFSTIMVVPFRLREHVITAKSSSVPISVPPSSDPGRNLSQSSLPTPITPEAIDDAADGYDPREMGRYGGAQLWHESAVMGPGHDLFVVVDVVGRDLELMGRFSGGRKCS